MKIKITLSVMIMIAIFCAPVHAVSIVDKVLYKEVQLQMYNQKLLVNRITGEVKYVWQNPTSVLINGKSISKDGDWVFIADPNTRKMWQEIYNRENT